MRRALSLLCALGAVGCGYALGRELGGDAAGVAAAWVVAASDLLRVYERWLKTGSRRDSDWLVERGIVPNRSATHRPQ